MILRAMILRAIAIAATLATPATADWFAISDKDWERLTSLTENYNSARDMAISGGAAIDVEFFRDVMMGVAGPETLDGTWACAIVKMGGVQPLRIDRNLTCVVTQTGPREWFLEQQTGPQRMRGIIRDDDGFLVFLGVAYFGDTPAADYQDLPLSQYPVGVSETVPVVGEVHQMDANRARIMMPYPIFESDFDILYLTRTTLGS